MSDLIDRQAAIDALMEILDRPNHAEFLYTDEICKALKALPSAQPEQRWIPCSERLPEEHKGASDTVLVTVARQLDGDKFVTMAFTMNGHWSCFEAEITAWMSLPEPFEEEKRNA